jgi:hypothetical protein
MMCFEAQEAHEAVADAAFSASEDDFPGSGIGLSVFYLPDSVSSGCG